LKHTQKLALGIGVVAVVAALIFITAQKPVVAPGAATAQPALTVTIATPELRNWPHKITATGSLQAWQEAIIGAEVGGLRLAEVRVNVGDEVKKDQVLARFSDEMVVLELQQLQAALAESRARLVEAEMKEASAKKLQESGVMSTQIATQHLSAAQMARAQVDAAEARIQAQKLKLGYTKVLASDDGIISMRTATEGAVLQTGSELFRLIRRNKYEWRAEVPEAQLAKIKIGQKVTLQVEQGGAVSGVVRRISPVIDSKTRNGVVYVELASAKFLRAGMFAQGEIALGQDRVLTVPQAALVVRDGFNYLYKVGDDSRVAQVKVLAGRRLEGRIEIVEGISANINVVASGAGFLSDGDLVRVTNTATASAAKPVPTKN